MTDTNDYGPVLTLHDGVPAIVMPDGTIRHTTLPALFDTGGGSYLAYADGWRDILDGAFPDGWRAHAEAVAGEFGLTVTEDPTIWLLVAMTLED